MLTNVINMTIGWFDDGRMPNVQQYDVNSHVFACRLWQKPGVPFVMADNAVVGAKFKWRRSNGSHEYETEIQDSSTVLVKVPAEALELEGIVEMQLAIYQNDGVLHGPVVSFAALRSLKPSDSEAEEPAMMLVALVNQTQKLLNEVQTALDNGEFNGEDGVGIESIRQTQMSLADGGTNELTVTLTDGTEAKFRVRNGKKGSSGQSINVIAQETTDEENVLTFSDGTILTVYNGKDGPAGADGYSPSINLTRDPDGVVISVTNKDGTQEAKVYDGEEGTGGSGGTGADGVGIVSITIEEV